MLHSLCENNIEQLQSFLRDNVGNNIESIINNKNSNKYTALHVSIFSRNITAITTLLEYGADANVKCHGTPALHLAAAAAVLPSGLAFARECISALLKHGADPLLKNDHGYTIVHVAAEYNLDWAIIEVLRHITAMEIVNIATKLTGVTALHLAAKANADKAVSILLEQGADANAKTTLTGSTPLHLAAEKGATDSWRVLVAKGSSYRDNNQDFQGKNPIDIIIAAGYRVDGSDPSKAVHAGDSSKNTLIAGNPLCSLHHTCPPSIVTTPAAPPENKHRIEVLIDPHVGALRSSSLKNYLTWNLQTRPAALSDILRVHEWHYVRQVQAQCEKIPSYDAEDEFNGIGHLDGDTAISRGTYRAALAAAGAVCTAVDCVVKQENRNAFCPVRPPGHHAGPRGVVTGEIAGSDSHGFCILNNVSIGAAYAMNRYRDKVERVAIVDFDVHHGNGTEETVRWLRPSVEQVDISSDVCYGVLQRPKYKPWFDEYDSENVLFVSVHGYGPRERGLDPRMVAATGATFYPGSGPTHMPPFIPPSPRHRSNSVDSSVVDSNDAIEDTAPEGVSNEPPKGEMPEKMATSEADSDEEEDEDYVDTGGSDGELEIVPTSQIKSTIGYEKLRQKQQMFCSFSQDARGLQNYACSTAEGMASLEAGVDPKDFLGISAMEPVQKELQKMPSLILDVGMSLPLQNPDDPDVRIAGGKAIFELSYRIQWRRYFREEIFPRLMQFGPDMIFISAGFDAHKKDTINAGYIALVEEDYEWVTQRLVAIANSCCDGRIVSVLEGGYQLGGEYCSAFAQSAKAHVTALAEGTHTRSLFSLEDSQAETEWEIQHLRKLEALRQQEVERRERKRQQEYEERIAAYERERQLQLQQPSTDEVNGVDALPDEANNAEDAGAGSAKKRRRSQQVDYVALDKKFREEQQQ